MGSAMLGARAVSRSRTAVQRLARGRRGLTSSPRDIQEWALREFSARPPVGRRPGARRPRPAPLAAVAGSHRRTDRGRRQPNDHVIPPARQRALARAIPGATMHDIDAGHAACALETEIFVPAFVEAVAHRQRRRRDFRQRDSAG